MVGNEDRRVTDPRSGAGKKRGGLGGYVEAKSEGVIRRPGNRGAEKIKKKKGENLAARKEKREESKDVTSGQGNWLGRGGCSLSSKRRAGSQGKTRGRTPLPLKKKSSGKEAGRRRDSTNKENTYLRRASVGGKRARRGP